ncbi:MAG: ester cyclase [Candidatus Marinimicrobia bacterium]|nr:ester cyclase [Candidatus Neomarinimicrobiota bacterium]
MPITDSEKTRRRALLKTHYDVENDHDMNGIMATFAPSAEMLYNRIPFADPQSIRHAHDLLGFSSTDGAFKDVHNYIDGEHFTEDEIIVEGRLSGKHVGKFQGIEATGRNVELPFVAFYHFDKTDKLISERVVMNLGALVA